MLLHEVLTIDQEHFLLFLQNVPNLRKKDFLKIFLKIIRIFHTVLFLSNKHNQFLLIGEEHPIDKIIVEHLLHPKEKFPELTKRKKNQTNIPN